MNKLVKSDYMFKGMVEEFNKNITAEAVVEDNKTYFHSIYDLYKFEKGIKTDVSKIYALSKYFKFSFEKYFTFLKI